jgi:hypothetical protein
MKHEYKCVMCKGEFTSPSNDEAIKEFEEVFEAPYQANKEETLEVCDDCYNILFSAPNHVRILEEAKKQLKR